MGSLHYDGFNVNWIDDMAILVTVIVAYNKTVIPELSDC